MATVNLGRIKPVFRGAYSGSTAYVIDDIVTHGNESFICIQAHGAGTQATSVTAYWTKLAAKGTDGTDVGTTITTQGDILYRDGSGLARLGFGTSGHVLTTKGTGANPAWEAAVGGKIGQIIYATESDAQSVSSASYADMAGMTITITPTATSSKVLLLGTAHLTHYQQYCYFKFVYGDGSDLTTQAIGDARSSRVRSYSGNMYQNTSDNAKMSSGSPICILDAPNTTSATTYKMQVRNSSGTNPMYLNRSFGDADNDTGVSAISTLIAMEVLA